MFDFHMHSHVSFDGRDTGFNMAKAAASAGLKEICFTDHMDYDPLDSAHKLQFDLSEYHKEYDGLEIPGLTIRRGFEFGMLPDNQEQFHKDISLRNWDFVIGSVHFVDDLDVYFSEYWEGKTPYYAILRSFEDTLTCVKNHDDFDVLGHLTYLGKCDANPVLTVLNNNTAIEMYRKFGFKETGKTIPLKPELWEIEMILER